MAAVVLVTMHLQGFRALSNDLYWNFVSQHCGEVPTSCDATGTSLMSGSFQQGSLIAKLYCLPCPFPKYGRSTAKGALRI